MPSLVDELPQFWKDYLPSKSIRLGLDLRGGTHLVLSVELDKAIQNSLEHTLEEIKQEGSEKKIQIEGGERKDARLNVRVANDSRSGFNDLIKDNFPNLSISDSSTEEGVTTVQLALTNPEERRLREFAIEQSLETIRNRIDQFGVTEPIIQREGAQDLLIQLPGIQDPQRAKELIGRTALLEFKLLSETPNSDDYISGKKPLPAGTEILGGTSGDRTKTRGERTKYLVESKVLMTGDVIADAVVRPGTQIDGPYVALELNARGAKQFDDLTGKSVNRRLAIILDNTVYSAPVIRERIGGGHASITGNFDIKEARDLAIVLRAGALPAPVHVAEERTVGPSLGKDSIQQGFTSFVAGGSLVVLFMLFYYRGAGIIADSALVLNVYLLLAALAALQATLTLPGIAGIVLTTGMAVDVNVLINERIREELRLGKTPKAAIDAGYQRALPAILDTNVTTFLSGLILFQFGSGPVKGFAVTLCVGLLTTLFTGVFCTRMVYDFRTSRGRLQSISI
ncbi:MAG: protein translocase subunit SecD [Deltaproteobacteria bacterium]|nr:protein translocase subunit SecD [Deltaproteobacteria bacterium]